LFVCLLLYCFFPVLGHANDAETRLQNITVVSDDNYPPYIFRDSNGVIQGILVDEWKLWEKKTGIKVNLIAMDWSKAQEFFLRGNADVIDTIFFTEERDKQYDFTKPYTKIDVPVFFHKNLGGIIDIASLQGFTIGVKAGDACIEVLKKQGITSFKEYNSYETIVNAAINGEIKVFSIDKPPALYYLYKMNFEDEFRCSFNLYTGEFHRAVKKGRTDILKIVEGGFALINRKEHDGIKKKWMGEPFVRPAHLRYVLSASLFAGTLFLVLVIFNITLRRKVRSKTSELQDLVNQLRESEEALRQSEYQLSIRNRINEIFLTISGEEMYGEVLKIVLEIMESKYGIFGYINEDDAWVCPSMTRDIWDECRIPDKAIIFAKDQWGGIWARAMNEKKALYSNKLFTVPEGHIQITRALDVPIVYQGALIGNLLVGNKETNYGEKDIQTLENIADKIAPVFHSTLQIEKQGREKKQLEAQLAQSQKMEAIGTLAGGVAHDFNNLLTTIIGNADLGLMDLGKDHPLRQGIEAIKKAANSAASLTRQLLAFSRKQIVQPMILDLNNLLTGIEKMLVRLIGEDIEILMIPESALWKVEIDPGQMEQVIMNLVANARDSMPIGGKLTIETANTDLDDNYFSEHGIVEERPGSYVMLAVSDTGSGMDKEVQEHIFDPFYTTKEKGKGTGLGLSTIYGIVKQNNGFIWVYSEPGQGSTFKIYLPKVKGDVKEEEKEQPPVENLSGSETVLIVEDDDSLRKLTRTVLKQRGYKILEAENGEDALRISKEHEGTIDLMITDVVMPKMGGKETAERLKTLHPQMKVIYMSGYTDNAIVHHGVLAAGLNFLEKPFSLEGLARKAREVLDKKQD